MLYSSYAVFEASCAEWSPCGVVFPGQNRQSEQDMHNNCTHVHLHMRCDIVFARSVFEMSTEREDKPHCNTEKYCIRITHRAAGVYLAAHTIQL